MPSTSKLRHILSAGQFDAETISRLFEYADRAGVTVEDEHRHQQIGNRLAGHILYRLFYKESTRTYESFGFAATHLGMNVLGTQSVQFSSVSKGESLEDTIRTICSYLPSMIVLRSASAGEAAQAAAVSTVPVINAGDGSGEHPTQGLLDLYTIKREFGRLDNLHIVAGGDMANSRTTRSLAKLLTLYPGNHFTFIAPPSFEMRDDILDVIRKAGGTFEQTTRKYPALEQADVLYWTRVQTERLTNDQKKFLAKNPDAPMDYIIDLPDVRRLKREARILHPLPRVNEITPAVDDDPRAAYFRQMHYGMLIRMALIEYVLGYL